MTIVSPKYLGLLIYCKGCGALLSYGSNDVYGNVVYCPICKVSTEVSLQKDYDGSIKQDDNKRSSNGNG